MLYLDHVELVKNSIDEEFVYMSAEYVLFSKDTSLNIPFSETSLFINQKKISGLETEIKDSLKRFYAYVIYRMEIDSTEFIRIIESSIKQDSIYLNELGQKNGCKIEITEHKGVGFLSLYQPRISR